MRHQALNDLIARSFSAADVPVTTEPSGLLRSDGKRPNGLSLVPWQIGKALCWDVTVVCPFADSYISGAAREPGSVAELAASRKEAKYAVLDGCYMFVPIAFENLGVANPSAKLLLTHLGRRLSEKSGESRETSFLFQRWSILLQRFNAVLLHDSARLWPHGILDIPSLFIFTIFLKPPSGTLIPRVKKKNNNNTKFIKRHNAVRRLQRHCCSLLLNGDFSKYNQMSLLLVIARKRTVKRSYRPTKK